MLWALFFPSFNRFFKIEPLRFVLDGQFSTPHDINAGVPQGSVLGHTLFLVYINDLPDGAFSRIRIYADDTIAYSSIQTSDFFDGLELTAELAEDVVFNATKTKLLSFNRHRESNLIPLKM